MRAAANSQAQKGVCDPIYRHAIQQLLDQQVSDPLPTSLVIINSFDFQLDDIREEMEDRRIHTEVFEIDRLQADQRLEYLNCFQDMFQTKKLPMIFAKDKLLGDFSKFKQYCDGGSSDTTNQRL